MQLLMARLQESPSARFRQFILEALAFFSAAFGPPKLIALVDAMQPGLFRMLCADVLAAAADGYVFVDAGQAKKVMVGLTRLVCESPPLLADPAAWGALFSGAVGVACTDVASVAKRGGDDDPAAQEFDAAASGSNFAKLRFAKKDVSDPLPQFPADCQLFFAQQLQKLLQAQPALKAGAAASPKAQDFAKLCQAKGVAL